MKNYIFLIGVLFNVTQFSFAQQDPHFSFWNVSPSLFNPATAGNSQGDLSIATNFRMQYLPIDGPAYRTNSVVIDSRIGKGSLSNGWFGTGITFYNDQSGDASLMTNMIKIPLSYTIEMNRENRIAIGASPGVLLQSFSGTQTWDNQWNGTDFNPSIPSGSISAGSVVKFDIGAGLFYQYENSLSRNKIYLGFSGDHLLSQDISLIGLNNPYYRKFTGHIGGQFEGGNGKYAFAPQAMFFMQGPNYSGTIGFQYISHMKQGSKRTDFVNGQDLTLGLHYRVNDGLIVQLGYLISGFDFGIAYDATISSLSRANKSFGGFEIYLRYQLNYSGSSHNFRKFH